MERKLACLFFIAFVVCAYNMVVLEKELNICRYSCADIQSKHDAKNEELAKLRAETELARNADPLAWEYSMATAKRLKLEICY